MTCHPIVVHYRGRWQAWCKPCTWESSWFDAPSWARAAAERHGEAAV